MFDYSARFFIKMHSFTTASFILSPLQRSLFILPKLKKKSSYTHHAAAQLTD